MAQLRGSGCVAWQTRSAVQTFCQGQQGRESTRLGSWWDSTRQPLGTNVGPSLRLSGL